MELQELIGMNKVILELHLMNLIYMENMNKPINYLTHNSKDI